VLLTELADGPQTVSQLATLLGINISTASKHISLLEQAQLLLKSRRGRELYCHVNFDPWQHLASYIAIHTQFWSGRLNELDAYLNQTGAR
jgi:DNA-binding transcriptional ArsR family regulator